MLFDEGQIITGKDLTPCPHNFYILMTLMMMKIMMMILTMTMTGNIIQDLKGSNIIQGHEWSHLSDGSDEIARIRQK